MVTETTSKQGRVVTRYYPETKHVDDVIRPNIIEKIMLLSGRVTELENKYAHLANCIQEVQLVRSCMKEELHKLSKIL